MKHERFHYADMQAVEAKVKELGVDLPLSEDTDVLFEKVTAGNVTFENRFVMQPMEGCDSDSAGAPDELTRDRYIRYAESGAGLIWMEAVAISQESRANPRQLYLHEGNVDAFARLVEEIRERSLKKNGFVPKIVMQGTHSGRYSKPEGRPTPIIAYNNPLFEKDNSIDGSRIITDEELKRNEEKYAVSAKLAKQAGFDGIDVKCCHRYLSSELLSAYNRPGEYGGSFENRTRFLRGSIANAKQAEGDGFFVTTRLNVYDGFPYPYGFGVGTDGSLTPVLDEGAALVQMLHQQYGLDLVNITIGNPYVNPHVNRPYDMGGYIPQEHPLEGVARMMHCVGQIQKNNPELVVIGSAFSYLRNLSPNLAAGAVKSGTCQMAGFGREGFAYPQFIHDLKEKGAMDPQKCCISCGKCSELMRMGTVAGCVIRNPKYPPIYQTAREAMQKKA